DAGPHSYDTIGRRRDGTEFPMELLIGTIAPSDGPAVLIYLADLTERRRSEAQRKLQEAQLRQTAKMEAVGQLAGGIAHDFNNLMTIVHGYTDLLLEEPDLSAETRTDLHAIRDAAERASVLTRQLLAFSRQQLLQPRLVLINEIVAPLVPMLQRLLGEEIELAFLAGDDLGAVRVDPSQLEQVVMNLAINARDAMPSGGRLTLETAEVNLDAAYVGAHAEATPGRYVVLAVSDTGIGMDEATRQRIFEPFFTTKDVGKGTGLGLATVYGIVKQSEGHVTVYSEPGHGSVFKVYLPSVDAPPSPGLTERRLVVLPPEQPTSQTILLVEDETAVRALMKIVLTRRGYRVLDASSPQAALKIAERGAARIDLVVTDVVMPGMTGPKMVRRLLALRPTLRVLYSSGYTERAIKGKDLVGAGATFLAKPFTPDELGRAVGEALATTVQSDL
ncbi:MAG TPA: ATP-binding protein, partial [Candidatus Saccharimonadales bacterium]|nr:ATP-binding protein [Candidatus Saccharimonadales bacterium]